MQNVVIAGFGFMGGMHAQVYKLLEKATLVGVIDQDKETAQARLDGLGMEARVYGTLEEALEKEAFTVLDICLPTDLHAEWAVKAAAAGKHLFCEKPLALKQDDGEMIAEAVEKAGVFVQVGHCIRFWPEYVALRDFIQSEEAGKLRSLSLQRRGGRPGYSVEDWLNDATRSGGAALDLHIHDTDFVLNLFGIPKAVRSKATVDYSGPSHIFTSYQYEDIVVEAEGGWNYPANWGFQMAFQAIFENGAVEYDSNAQPTLKITIGEEEGKPMPFEQPVSNDSSTGEGNIQSLGGYYNELAYFIDCVETDHAPEIATLLQARQSLNTTLEEIRSAREEQTIIINS